jgi:2-C-methyl-D-erythritol 4-phosphate cytidylyltransferase
MYCSDTKIVYTLIVAAAGIGKRMNLGYPKQFLEYKGKPLFMFCLETAQKTNVINDIVVVTGEESINYVKVQCEKYGIDKVREIIAGGKERQDSIYNAIKICKNSDIIAVQDGVRPFMKEQYLENAKKVLSENETVDGVIVGVPVKDTIKVINREGEILQTPERSFLMAAQTPQIFRGKTLREAYSKARKEKFLGTDDSSLVERIGKKVIFIEGNYDNIKITTQEDLKFLKQEE